MRCLLGRGAGNLSCRTVPEGLAYTCDNNCYINSSGHLVYSPSCGQEHKKRIAECRDGSGSFSEHHRGVCSYHRGAALGLTRPLMDGARSWVHGCPKPAPPPQERLS
jgi:hypothetical protein